MLIDIVFWITFLALIGSIAWTIRRTKGQLSAASLIPLGWILLVPAAVVLKALGTNTGLFPGGFVGQPRDDLYLAMSLGNAMFLALELFLLSPAFARLGRALAVRLEPRTPRGAADAGRPTRYWFIGLSVVAIGLALLHWRLMPRIPAWDLLVGFANAYQTALDRENSEKLLAAPALLKYAFTWNSSILFPLLFCLAVLRRWRWPAILIGVFGFLYVASTLEKFPAMALILAPFVAFTIRAGRPLWSKWLLIGLGLSLLAPGLIGQAPAISTSVHQALGIKPPAASSGPSQPNVDPSCASDQTFLPDLPPNKFSPLQAPLVLLDLVRRRIFTVPAETTYAWFAYFPRVHDFMHGTGWEPWRVLSPNYRNPSNLVGLWAYCGHGARLPSVSAYGSFIADGWGEFGHLGVLIACIGLFLFACVIELMRVFIRMPFCLACYAPALLLFATLPPRAGILATVFSSGLWLSPLLAAAYLLTERFRPAPRLEVITAHQLS